jgi:hypothetical protein
MNLTVHVRFCRQVGGATLRLSLTQHHDGQRLTVRQAKADSIGTVPLSPSGKSHLDGYLESRELQGGVFLAVGQKPTLSL